MGKKLVIPFVIIIATASIAMSGTAGATNHWGDDDCFNGGDGQGPVLSAGEYSGEIMSPDDQDSFEVQLDHGEYLSIRASAPENLKIDMGVEADFSKISTQEVSGANRVSGSYGNMHTITYDSADSEGTWELWAEENTNVCVSIEAKNDEPDVPFNWALAFEKNDPEPPEFNPGDKSLEDEITKLESENEELQNKIDELEAELASSQNKEVTIDVTVRPENQATFQVGGEMGVNVETSGTSATNVALSYAGEEYTASGGEASIPLESAGSQQLEITYEDTTEAVTLDVANQETDNQNTETPSEEERTGDQPNTDDGDSSDGGSAEDEGITDSDGDGVRDSEDYAPNDPEVQEKSDIESNSGDSVPGFGILAGLIAIVAMTTIAQRKQQQ